MIKRPLVWILFAYLVGMFFAWNKIPVVVPIIVMLVLSVITYLLMFRFENKFINRRDKFLWSLPLLLVLGFCSMRGQLITPKLDTIFDQKISCVLSGEISMIAQKQWGRAIYVKNDVISILDQDQYVCENVIVFCYDQNKANNQDETNSQSKVINQDVTINQSKVIVQNEINSQSYTRNQDQSLNEKYLVGNRITVYGTLQKFSIPTNQGQFNEKLYYQIENIDYKMKADKITVIHADYSRFHAILDRIKNKLLMVYANILSEKESGTLIAMLLGEKYLLNDEIKQLYQVNGISHLLAISGLHVSLIGMAVFYLLKKCKLPVTFATIFSIIFIYCYGVLTNFSVSTNRAVVMMTIMLIAALIGKTYDMLSALSLSAIIILLQNPLQLLSAGFMLSYGAVLGIAVIYPCLQKIIPSKNPLISSLFISISAQAVTTPFVIYYFYQFPVYSIITNLIILPFVTVLTLTSIIAGIAGAIYLPFGTFLIGGSNYILKFYEWICRIGSNLPGNLITVGIPRFLNLFIYIFLFVVFIWLAHKYEKWYFVFIIAVATVILILPKRNSGLEITVLDVGQGDSTYIESESGRTYLVDGGSADVKKVGINRIQPFLMSKGTDVIDYVFMTHSDNDHISGLLEIIEEGKIKIRNLVLPNITQKDDAYINLEVLAKGKNITIKYIDTGDTINDGQLRMVCLNPIEGYAAATSNSYSTVLSMSYGEFDMLLTGDMEGDGEKMVTNMLEKPELWGRFDSIKKFNISPVVDYDILKVAHHGSKNSTYAKLLGLVQPECSLISCGKNNSYGHPHKELINRLEDIGSEIMITYETGAITIRTNGKRLEMEEYLKK